jgi:hypothetical protein
LIWRAGAEDHHRAEDARDGQTEQLEQRQSSEQQLVGAVAGEHKPLIDRAGGQRCEDRSARDREGHRDPTGDDCMVWWCAEAP